MSRANTVNQTSELPLGGIRVLEAATAVSGPYIGGFLGDLGAEVLKLEGPDASRMGAHYNEANRNKLGFSLNLGSPRGRDLLHRIVSVSDVAICNLRPDAIPHLGLDYASLCEANPEIISIRVSAFGGTGPAALQRGTAPTIEGASGTASLNGYPGGIPLRPGGYYADLTSALFGLLATLSALRFRDQYQTGQEIDVAMTECTAHLLGDAIFEYFRDGVIPGPTGNRDLSGRSVPNDCFPCKGEDEWIALSIRSDTEWQQFCDCTNHSQWGSDQRFVTRDLRQLHESELTTLLTEWSESHSAVHLMEVLQSANIPAARVARPEDLLTDPQIEYRRYFAMVDQQGTGVGPMPRLAFESPLATPWACSSAPRFAEHNDYVFRYILGLSAQEVESLYRDGVSSTKQGTE